MISEAEKFFWEHKAEKLLCGYLEKMGNPENYEKYCEIVAKRLDGNLALKKKITNGRIYYKWQKQKTN